MKSFVKQIVFQSLNITQVTIAIKVNQWENDISSKKKKKTTEKMAAKKLNREHCSLSGINK